MAKNTFRQTIMGNAQPKPFWEQPVPTKAPPAMVGPAAPTPEQMQSMEPATAPQAAPVQMPPTTQAQVDARTAARGGNGQGEVPSLSDDIGQTLKGMFVDPLVSVGEGIGEWAGAQKYGTGISAEGEATGHPIARPSLLGDIATLPGTALNVAGLVTDPAQAAWNAASDLGERQVDLMKKGVDYVTGQTATPSTPNQPTVVLPTQQAPSVDMGSEVAAEPAPEPAIKPQSAVQLDPTSDEAILARRAQRQGTSSPQQNFQLRVSNGEPLSQEEITQAEALAEHMGTTFDPVTGYSRQPFLDAQSTPQQGVQQGAGLTTVGGAPLNEFLSGAAMPEQGFARAENAMYGDNSLSRGLAGDAATKAFQDASDARVARMGLSNRPGVDVPSLDMQRSRMDAGLDPVEGAPTGTDMSQQQQRDALERGFDPATGQPIKNKEGLTFEQAMAERRQRLAENKFDYERVNDFNAATQEEAAAISKAQDAQSRDAMTGKGMKRSVLDMLDVMDNVGGRLDQFMSTGMTGKAASFWKGSEADAQEADFAFLKSNVALKAMMELKAQSSTGATGFGALNTEELKVLTNRFATLDPFTKPDIIRENLVRLRDQTKAMFEDAKIRHAEQYGPEAAEAVYGDLIRSTGGAKGASQQSSVPNDQNVAGKADHLFSSGKY